MGLLDNLKGKAEELGEKAKGGFDLAKDKASELVDDVKGRLDTDEPTNAEKVAEAADPSPASVQESVERVRIAAEDDEPESDPADLAQDRYDEVLEAGQAKSDELKDQH